MQFEYDILISFSPLDNQLVQNGEDGWVTEFRKSLELRLSQLIGRKPMIHSNDIESIDDQHDVTDIDASNGVIHVIDSVLMPK
mgnify:CR=1 FL=1